MRETNSGAKCQTVKGSRAPRSRGRYESYGQTGVEGRLKRDAILAAVKDEECCWFLVDRGSSDSNYEPFEAENSSLVEGNAVCILGCFAISLAATLQIVVELP